MISNISKEPATKLLTVCPDIINRTRTRIIICRTTTYVMVDALLDPEGEDLPWIRMIEVRAMTRSQTLRESPEERNIIAENLDSPITNGKASNDADESDEDPTIIESLSHGPEFQLHVEKTADFIQDGIPS